jgi:PncC family amidohydrolase
MTEAARVLNLLRASGEKAALAESCTAGLASDILASIPGASDVFWGGFVTYSVEAKVLCLGVDSALIGEYGAVSRECAIAMAEGACNKSGCGWGLAITGLAGPAGDDRGQEPGTVWVAVARRGGPSQARLFHYEGDRNSIRRAAARDAIAELAAALAGEIYF